MQMDGWKENVGGWGNGEMGKKWWVFKWVGGTWVWWMGEGWKDDKT